MQRCEEESIMKMIIANDKMPCLICGNATQFVDISHARICSDKCLAEFNKMVDEYERTIKVNDME